MSQKKTSTKRIVICVFITLGITLRYVLMTLGHNYDFESYCIVGEISGNLRSVYAETSRYNYAPIFLCILGILYRISLLAGNNWMLLFRVLIVALLTSTDLCITAFIANRYSWAKALTFFLNPVSIIITGYHNQFDNIAILFALLSVYFISESVSFEKRDYCAILFLSLSLMAKHILFLFPVFILLLHYIPLKKRIVYACVPPFIFLLSFVPFAIGNQAAFDGILNNVFLYRSFNNAPLLNFIYDRINFPSNMKIIVYALLMLILAITIRRYTFEKALLMYLIAMVAFSSAIANQYLVIPMVAICALEAAPLDKIYMLCITFFLILSIHGLKVLEYLQETLGKESRITRLATIYNNRGYNLAVAILFIIIVMIIIRESKQRKRAA